METKIEKPSQKPVLNIMSKETMGKELILQSDELKVKLVTSQKKNERKDFENICAHCLESVYDVIAAEKQPERKHLKLNPLGN